MQLKLCIDFLLCITGMFFEYLLKFKGDNRNHISLQWWHLKCLYNTFFCLEVKYEPETFEKKILKMVDYIFIHLIRWYAVSK